MRNKTKVHNANTALLYRVILKPNRNRCQKKSGRRETLSLSGACASCDRDRDRDCGCHGCHGCYGYQRKDRLGQQKLHSHRGGKSHVRYHSCHSHASCVSSLSCAYRAYDPRHSHLSRRPQVLQSYRGDRHQACDQRRPLQHHRGV